MSEADYLAEIAAHDDALNDHFAVAGHRAQVAFAAVQAERLLPLYREFSGADALGSEVLAEGLDAVWRWMESSDEPDTSQRDRCLEVAPDSEGNPGARRHAATNAGIAVAGAIELTYQPNPESAVGVGGLVIELFDAYADEDATREELKRQRIQAHEAERVLNSSAAVEGIRRLAEPDGLRWSGDTLQACRPS